MSGFNLTLAADAHLIEDVFIAMQPTLYVEELIQIRNRISKTNSNSRGRAEFRTNVNIYKSLSIYVILINLMH
jgi:hypothetical protein